MLIGQNLDQLFNSRLGCACVCCAFAYLIKRPNLKLKTWLKQLSGYLPQAFAFLIDDKKIAGSAHKNDTKINSSL